MFLTGFDPGSTWCDRIMEQEQLHAQHHLGLRLEWVDVIGRLCRRPWTLSTIDLLSSSAIELGQPLLRSDCCCTDFSQAGQTGV